ncbi:MAB_1171c family putative transporter [Kitasatospora sp. NPDC094011]|uniref:MAB_1171c family putative transporter n=1 Tax=Kitasatospora sp. NPDC094011 TaxID=3364090 RepID=UPI003820C828
MEEPLMRPLFTWLMPTLIWGVVLWRVPTALTTRANRALWAGFTAMALGLSCRPAFVEHALGELTGIRDVTQLLKHLAGVAAAYFLLEYVQAVRHRAERPGAARARLVVMLAAGVALTLLFVYALPHDADGAFGIDAHYGHLGVKVYLYVFNTVFALASARAMVLFRSKRAAVPRGALRTGVSCLTAGSATGLVYTLYRYQFILVHGDATEFDAQGRPVPVQDLLCELLPAVMLVLFVLGVVIPPAGRLVGHLRDQYALWRLHPLWADVAAVVPHVVLGTAGSRLRDLLIGRDRSVELAHRAFAIRDAVLVLREDTPVADADADGGADGGAGVAPTPGGGDGDLARVEARWLRAAVRHRARDLPAPALPAALAATTGGRTPREEIAWMLAVAAAYRQVGAEETAR